MVTIPIIKGQKNTQNSEKEKIQEHSICRGAILQS